MNTLLPALAFALSTLPLQDPAEEPAAPDVPPVRAAIHMEDPLELPEGSELIVVNQGDSMLERVDARTGEILARLETGFMPHEAAVSGDGAWAVTANFGSGARAGNSLTVIDLSGKVEPRHVTTKGHGFPHGIAFIDRDTEVLVTAEMTNSIVRANVRNGELEAIIPLSGDGPHVIELNEERTRAYVCNVRSHNISVIDLETNEEIKVVDVGEQPEGVAMRPGGKELWVCNRISHTITIVDTETLEVLETIETGMYPIRIGFSPDGKRALVSCIRSSTLAMVDADSREQLNEVPMKMIDYDPEIEKTHFGRDKWAESSVPYDIAVDPDGRYAFIGEVRAGTVAVLDIEQQKIVRRYKTGFLPDGLTLVQRKPVVDEAGQGD